MTPVIVLGRDEIGLIAQSDGIRYYLTDCCYASAKGTESGVACRACYTSIPDVLGSVPAQSGPVPQPFGHGIPYDELKGQR